MKIKVNNIKPDKYQKKVVKSKAKNLLVLAGAGSGKTFTIVAKIKYLIEKGIRPEEILCISFTKASSKSLEEKIKKENINLKVKTFHSLGYGIIKKYKNVKLTEDTLLRNIINKNIEKCENLREILNLEFKRLGYPDKYFKKLENNIIMNYNYKPKLEKIMNIFINLYKSGNHSIKDFQKFEKTNNKNNLYDQRRRHNYFLKLIKQTIIDYNQTLKRRNEIDYHDMINLATKIVKKKGIYPYKYIIIDEYQDTSLNKTNLIREIQNKTNANLLALGDDWQSIYAFTGSNLEIFTKFKKIFPKSKIMKLKNTYRNPKELLDVTSKFICQNPRQIHKKLKSNKSITHPIQIYYYSKSLEEVWEKVINNINPKDTIILGRNNNDMITKDIPFLTMHKSKGLESENVIIINLEDKYNSIPSQIKESEYLTYVKPKIDDYPYAEERRLFYVALTRTKNKNYLLVNKNTPSIFVKELLKYYGNYITEYNK